MGRIRWIRREWMALLLLLGMGGHGCIWRLVYIYCTGELVWAGRGEIGRGHFVNRYRYLSDGEIMPKFILPKGE